LLTYEEGLGSGDVINEEDADDNHDPPEQQLDSEQGIIVKFRKAKQVQVQATLQPLPPEMV
jgi:hypothetical protein